MSWLSRIRGRGAGPESAPETWSVASVVAEPPDLLYAFAAHYLELGAEEVHLFIDDPEQPGLETLSAMDGVRLTICDAAFWKDHGGRRPKGQEVRQVRCATRAYRDCRSDWFLFCDGDEYLHARAPVGEMLARQPAEILHCRPYMAERAFPADRPQAHLFDGRLKAPLPNRPKILKAVYGPLAPFTTAGLLGHVIGKSFTRTGHDLRIRIHMPAPFDPEEEKRQRAAGRMAPGPRIPDCWLVHYDGLTPLHWRLKLLRYALEYDARLKAGDKAPFAQRLPSRLRQLKAVHETLDAPAETFRKMMPLIRPDAEMLAQLEQAGGIIPDPFDPRAAAQRRITPPPGFSPQVFDDALRAKRGDLIDAYGIDF